jgi:hypothetical protein
VRARHQFGLLLVYDLRWVCQGLCDGLPQLTTLFVDPGLHPGLYPVHPHEHPLIHPVLEGLSRAAFLLPLRFRGPEIPSWIEVSRIHYLPDPRPLLSFALEVSLTDARPLRALGCSSQLCKLVLVQDYKIALEGKLTLGKNLDVAFDHQTVSHCYGLAGALELVRWVSGGPGAAHFGITCGEFFETEQIPGSAEGKQTLPGLLVDVPLRLAVVQGDLTDELEVETRLQTDLAVLYDKEGRNIWIIERVEG